MTIHQLKGFRQKFATGKPTVLPADRIRFELRKLGLGDWVNSAPGNSLTANLTTERMWAVSHLRAMVDGAVSYAERISADEGRIARERFAATIEALEELS